MTHITLLISLFFCVLTQSIHTMEEHKKLSLREYRRQPHTKNSNEKLTTENNTIPTITITTANKPEKRTNALTQSNKELKRSQTFDPYAASSTPIHNNAPNTAKELLRSSSHEPSLPKPKLEPLELHKLSDEKIINSYPSEKQNSSEKTKREYPFPKFLSKSDDSIKNTIVSPQTNPSKTPLIGENNIISVVRFHGIKELQTLLNDPNTDPNHQNKFKMTALHYAALKAVESKRAVLEAIESKIAELKIAELKAVESKNAEIINLLLNDPRTNSCLKNDQDKLAAHLIVGGDQCDEIRKLLFARLTLDKNVSQEMFIMLINLHIKKELINNHYINKTVDIIKRKALRAELLQQSDRVLPEDAKLPDYAKDEFIAEMVEHRIPNDTKITKKLITKIYKEIQNLPDVEIDKKMIMESAERIIEAFSPNTIMKLLTEGKSSRKNSNPKSNNLYLPQHIDKNTCLPPYIDYEFIFNVMQSYIEEKKVIDKPSFLEIIPGEISTKLIKKIKK